MCSVLLWQHSVSMKPICAPGWMHKHVRMATSNDWIRPPLCTIPYMTVKQVVGGPPKAGMRHGQMHG